MRIDEASKDRQDQSAQVIASNEKAETSLETHRIYRVGLAYGRLVYRFRWFVLAFWLIVLAASVPFASKLPAILSSGGYSFSNSESVHVANLLIDRFHQPPSHHPRHVEPLG